jgi:hypothetical protein
LTDVLCMGHNAKIGHLPWGKMMNFPSIVFQIAACDDANFLTCVFWIFYVSKVSITSSSSLHVWSTNIYKKHNR